MPTNRTFAFLLLLAPAFRAIYSCSAVFAMNTITVLTNKFLMEAGSSNTLLRDDLALTVKMSDKLALSVGHGDLCESGIRFLPVFRES